MKRLLIVVGSKNDIPHLKESIKLLEQSKIKFQVKIISAHRNIGQLVRELEPKKLKKEGVVEANQCVANVNIWYGEENSQCIEKIDRQIEANEIDLINKGASLGCRLYKN